MKAHLRFMKTTVVLLLFFFLGVICYGLICSRYLLQETYLSVVSNKTAVPFRIVQLTDLHNSEFGEKNYKLVERVAELEPDLILVTGDLLNSDNERTDIAADLISGLSGIAPLYVSFGNHEKAHENRYGTDLRALYTEAGAVVLEYDWVDITVKGQAIRLGGLYGYCLPAYLLETHEARENECAYLSDFQDTDRMTILMCHMPVCWLKDDSLNNWDVDFVFAGHSHGGQIQIPFIGGLWAPDQDWFPGRVSGLFYSDDGRKVMILSRGLGSNEKIPRFNNRPEIMVVDFEPD